MKSKRALVTGASEGIGRAFAQALAARGYEITAVARNEARLRELIASLPGGPHRFVAVDLSDLSRAAHLAETFAAERYDVLINNAGFGVYGAFDSASLEKLQSMTRLNCDALVILAHAYLRSAKRGDALINTASTLGFLPLPGGALYAATKAFVVSLSEALWFESKDRGVYVTALCPGVTETRFHHAAGGSEGNRPPKAITQTPEGVAAAAMRALERRSRPSVLTSFTNRMMVLFNTRFLSRKGSVSMMGRLSPGDDRPAARLAAPAKNER
jgi:short-subunit dehydrogenase